MFPPYRVVTTAIVAAFVLTTATPGNAAPFVFDVSVDLAAVPIEDVVVGGDAGNRIRFTADFPDIDDFLVTDTLHLNVSFANGALIRLVDRGAPFLGNDERILGRTVLQGVFRGSDRHHVFLFTGVQGDLRVNPLITDSFENDLNLTNSDFAISGLAIDLTFSNPFFDPALPIFGSLVEYDVELWADTISVEGLNDVAVPEPSTIALVALGLVALARRIRRRWTGD